jgi:hypothetical protein
MLPVILGCVIPSACGDIKLGARLHMKKNGTKQPKKNHNKKKNKILTALKK